MGDNIQGNLRPEITASVPSCQFDPVAQTRVIKDRRSKTPPISIENYISTTGVRRVKKKRKNQDKVTLRAHVYKRDNMMAVHNCY